MNQFRDSFVGYRQYWVLAQRAALLCRCASATGFGGQSIHRILLRYEFAPCFQRNILGGLLKFLAVGCGLNDISPSANSSGTSHLSPDGGGLTRAAVHRLAADGYARLALYNYCLDCGVTLYRWVWAPRLTTISVSWPTFNASIA